MAYKCDICGKGSMYGNTVSHANNKHRTRRKPNLQSFKADVPGRRKRIQVCTRCIRSGKVKKPLQANI